MNYKVLKPTQPKVVSQDGNKATFEIENLYPGYGHTLGNSLRRIIHSSVPGVAVTAISIEGVPHEFSTINGVVEDVMNIILNLKRVNFKMTGDEMQVVTIEAKGEKVVTANDIKAPSQIEVINTDQHIATLSAKTSSLKMEITLEKGIGYAAKESRVKNEKAAVGTIILDADFTPIRRVKYDVENMRVGDRTDYNKLVIGIETDGTATPNEVLEESIDIMIEQLEAMKYNPIKKTVFADSLDNRPFDLSKNSDNVEVEEVIEEDGNTKIKVEDLPLSVRTSNALMMAGIKSVAGLLRKTEDDIFNLEGLGAKAVEEIKEALGNLGLELKAKK
jgi:DNA-directed RNA polymerase subunit alpha